MSISHSVEDRVLTSIPGINGLQSIYHRGVESCPLLSARSGINMNKDTDPLVISTPIHVGRKSRYKMRRFGFLYHGVLSCIAICDTKVLEAGPFELDSPFCSSEFILQCYRWILNNRSGDSQEEVFSKEGKSVVHQPHFISPFLKGLCLKAKHSKTKGKRGCGVTAKPF